MSKKYRTALVVGGSEDVFREVESALEMFTPDAVIALNHSIAKYDGRITHACTLHSEKLRYWQDARRDAGFNTNYRTIAIEKPAVKDPDGPKIDVELDYRWPHTGSGSTGLYGVRVALLLLKCERVVLAGVPMTPGASNFVTHKPWDAALVFRAAWVSALPHLNGKVRSMSGWTREILGFPTPKWLGNSG